MPQMNIDAANQNLRWCLRAYKDGELQDLSLYLFRKAMSQLVLENIQPETISEVLVANLGREVTGHLIHMNTEIMMDPKAMQNFNYRISGLFI